MHPMHLATGRHTNSTHQQQRTAHHVADDKGQRASQHNLVARWHCSPSFTGLAQDLGHGAGQLGKLLGLYQGVCLYMMLLQRQPIPAIPGSGPWWLGQRTKTIPTKLNADGALSTDWELPQPATCRASARRHPQGLLLH